MIEKLENLNLSHNQYSGWLKIEKNSFSTLKELNISYNKLKRIYVSDPLYRIILCYNDLTDVDINHKNIQYLDISYNSNMSERVTFNLTIIDTIIREGVVMGSHYQSQSTIHNILIRIILFSQIKSVK